MALEQIEEWIGTKEELLRKGFVKWTSLAAAAVATALSAILPATPAVKVLLPTTVASVMLAIWQFVRSCRWRATFRKLQADLGKKPSFRRQLYWLPNDAVPLCPHCQETVGKNVHLSGTGKPDQGIYPYPVAFWKCLNCGHSYSAREEEDFGKFRTPK